MPQGVAEGSAPTVAAAPRPRRAGADGPKIPHLPALDGLRGSAVVAVLAFHGGYLTGGYLGVDLFFVLSGYLITSLMLAELGGGRGLDLGQFWARRCKRLLPALFATTIATAIGARLWSDPVTWRAVRDDGLATLGYVANWHTLWTGGTYGAAVGGRSLFEHTWSLAIEEQFYLLWPLAVVGFLAHGQPARRILRFALVLAAAAYAGMVAFSFAGTSSTTLYLATHTRIAGVALGCALAAWRKVRRRPTTAVPAPMVAFWGWCAVLVLGIAWTQLPLTDDLLYRGGFVVCGIAATVLIWSSAEPSMGGPDLVFGWRPLREIGLRSYGLYLWHWPIFMWLDLHRPFDLHGLPLFALKLGISAAVAMASYRYLEQPIRRSSLAPRAVFSAAAGGALVAVGALVLVSVGAPPPLTIQSQQVQAGDVDAVAGKGREVAIFGDSVAEILANQGVVPKADELGISARDGGIWGCSLVAPDGDARDGFDHVLDAERNRPCALDWPDVMARIGKAPTVTVMFFGGIPFDIQIDGTWRHPCDPEYVARYRQRAEDAIRALGSTGSSVAVVLPAPARTRASIKGDGIVDITERQACVAKPLQEAIEATGAGTVDLLSHQCGSDDACRKDGDPDDPRRDGLHYEHDAAIALARWLVPEAIRVAHKVS